MFELALNGQYWHATCNTLINEQDMMIKLQAHNAMHLKQKTKRVLHMKKILLPVAIAAAATFTGSAFAADQTGTANVTVMTAVSVGETTQADFGSMEMTDGTCTMDTNGDLSGICSGSGTRGVMTITGYNTETVNISVSTLASDDGVTFNPVVDNASDSLVGGSLAVNVYGAVVLSGVSTAGAKTPTYTFTAAYP